MKVTTDACLFGAVVASTLDALKSISILDIGTGTGLLSLMVMQATPNSTVDAIEIDKEAFLQAKDNTSKSPWKERVNIINKDILIYEEAGKYDLVISNPPFYENDLRSADHRRNLALHNADLPLKELFIRIRDLVKPNGKAWLLLPFKRNGELRSFLENSQLSMERLIMVKPSTRHEHFRLILCLTHYKDMTETAVEELCIMNEKNQYTEEFSQLLRPYYLKL